MAAPLSGKRILVTRDRKQAEKFTELLKKEEAEPVGLPLLTFSKKMTKEGSSIFSKLHYYSWLFFTSANGVKFFFDILRQRGNKESKLDEIRVASIGSKTAKALAEHGITPDFQPSIFNGTTMAKEFLKLFPDPGPVLLVQGNLSRKEISSELEKQHIFFDRLVVYDTLIDESCKQELNDHIDKNDIDVYTFTSPSTVQAFEELTMSSSIKKEIIKKERICVCIGSTTEQTAKKAGFLHTLVPAENTIEKMVEVMTQHFNQKGKDNYMENLPFKRHRRLRSSHAMRAMVRETHITPDDLIYPIFVAEGEGIRKEISSMPGIYQLSLDNLMNEIREVKSLGIRSVLLFGIPKEKDEQGSQAYAEEGIVQEAMRLIKKEEPEILLVADTCLCEFTSHGHCGIIHEGEVDNDTSLDLIVRTAISQAKAGADIIAPSNMMDGFVAAIRKGLDDSGFKNIPIMSYAVKYSSSFYGPFREAAESAPQFGDRKGYQMDPANRREALREAQSDIEEGADFLIVKPGLSYLDIMREVKDHFNAPMVAYNVSGEYSMVKAAAQKGWISERELVMEKMISMKRAGADLIITYFAKDVAKWINE